MLKKFSLILVAFLAILNLSYSQGVTTASISGKVTDANGKPLTGTTIKVVHLPTGTTAGAVTNAAGRFNIVGLRVGGPYTVTISMVGYETQVKEDITLGINQNLNMDIRLNEKGVQTGIVNVVADRNEIISSNRTGASQAITESEIKSLPTIARSIHDYSRLSPHIISSTSEGSNVGGRNSKYNNIQVDGAIMSDPFGLSSAGTPGGQAGTEPISLDAIQEFQVAVAPFDVRLGGFTGGLINAITRSGSNYYRGSAYFYGRNEKMVGNAVLKNPDGSRSPYPEYTDYQLGGRLGGPILQDKLFFFVNGEIRQRAEPQTLAYKGETGANVFGLSRNELKAIRDTVISKYGYDPGSYDNYTRNVDNIKLFLRLDYNISNQHRLTLRHNFVDASQDNAVSRSRTFFSYSGQEYIFRSTQNQTVLQLNSVVAKDMANELRIAYTQINDKRDFQSVPFPSVTISSLGDDKRSSVSFGVERFSQANALDQNILEITDNFNYFLGDHVFTIGTTNQYIKFSNLFVQDAFGTYTFSGLQNFLDNKPSRYYYSYLLPGGKPRAEFGYWQFGVYAQDEWKVLPNLKLTIGLRGDFFAFPDEPSYNKHFDSVFKMKTSEMPSPFAFSPRFGFNYDVFNDKNTQLRGGIGLFAGRTPGVWISNQYSNTGVDYGRVDVTSNVPAFVPDPKKQPKPGDPGSTLQPVQTSEVNITDKDFKMPQVLRFNVAVDQQLTDGLIGTLEFIYGKSINDVLFQNILLVDSTDASGNRVTSIDGRPMYLRYNSGAKLVSNKYTNVIYMTNTDKGDQLNISAQLQKPFGQGFLPNFSANFAYTYSVVRDVNSTTSSRAISNWMYNHAVDPNNPKLTTSLFSIPHRILANVSYRWVYDKNSELTIGLFYEGRSGSPMSFLYYTQSNITWDKDVLIDTRVRDANNDNVWGNDLCYIPNELKFVNGAWQDDKMILVNGDQEYTAPDGTKMKYVEALEKFLSDWDDLKRGKIMDRFGLHQPWRHQLDLRISQEIPTVGRQRIELTLDILNVLNLLNKDWGQVKYVRNGEYSLFRFEGYDKSGKIRASYFPNTRGYKGDDIFETSDFWSRWQMQFGIRYTF